MRQGKNVVFDETSCSSLKVRGYGVPKKAILFIGHCAMLTHSMATQLFTGSRVFSYCKCYPGMMIGAYGGGFEGCELIEGSKSYESKRRGSYVYFGQW